MSEHSELWNDLPAEERKRLMPHQIESQILHMRQCEEVAIRSHKRHMKELNDWIKNLERDLSQCAKEQEREVGAGVLPASTCSVPDFWAGPSTAGKVVVGVNDEQWKVDPFLARRFAERLNHAADRAEENLRRGKPS